jgi:hypothetical protein
MRSFPTSFFVPGERTIAFTAFVLLLKISFSFIRAFTPRREDFQRFYGTKQAAEVFF